jgi:hypothetical protein
VRLIGDDLFTTNPQRLARSIAAGCANGVLIKANQNQNGTLTGTLEVARIARDAGYVPVVSARSGETEDDSLPFAGMAGGVSSAAWTPWTCGRRQDAQPGVMVRAGVVSWPSVASSASSSPVRSTVRRNSSGM